MKKSMGKVAAKAEAKLKNALRRARLVKRAKMILGTIESAHRLYPELDKITDELIEAGFMEENGVVLVDNYETGNVQWGAKPFRAYELQLMKPKKK